MHPFVPWAVLLCSASLAAQPGIGQNGVVNRASQIPPTLPGGSLARGAAFTIHGIHFGSGARVEFRKGTVSIPVALLETEPEKIEAVVPATAPLGPASLVVTVKGSSSKAFPVALAASNPGIFSHNGRGWGPGEIENLDHGKRSANAATNPAIAGQRVVMRVTGLGKSSATIVVGNRPAIAGAPRALAKGEQEVSFTVPADAPKGCYVPVFFQVTPTRASNVVTMAIGARSDRCEPGPIPLLEAQRVGIGVFTRADMLRKGATTISDEALVLFSAKSRGPALSPLLLLPPPGTCTAYTGSFQNGAILPDSLTSAMVAEIQGDGLAAGARLNVSRENNSRSIPSEHGAAGYYRARLGSSSQSRRSSARGLFLDGPFEFSGPGGMDVGPFHVMVDGPAPFEWIGRDAVGTVDRSRGLSLSWRGEAAARLTIVLATNVDQISTAIGTCLCTAPVNATHFEIPAVMLANIPASIDMPGVPYDQLFIASLPAKMAAPIQAPGIGAGAVLSIFANGRLVQYH